MANNPYTTGGGGGGSSSKNPYGGGGSSGGGGGKKKQPVSHPKQDLIRTISRINRIQNPSKRAMAQKEAGQALQGFSGEQIYKIGRKADLTPADVQAIVLESGAEHGRQTTPDFLPEIATGLDWLDRVTARPAKAAVVEGQGGLNPVGLLTGFKHGLVEGKSYPGAQALIAVGTHGTPEQTAKTRESLPGPVRTAADFGGDVVFDWSNWVTLGGGALAEGAARTVAKAAAGQALEDAALNKTSKAILEGLTTRGLKSLTREQRAAAEGVFTKGKIPRGVARKVERSTGGIRFAGQPIYGTRRLNRKFDQLGVKPGGAGSGTEAALRVRGELKQGVRANELGRNVPQDVENILAQRRGAEFMGNMAPTRATRGAEEAVGRTVVGADASAMKAAREGRKILERDPEILDRVRNSLDVGGGAAAVAKLPPGERDLAVFLRGMSDEDFAALQSAGRLRSDAQMATTSAPIRREGMDLDELINRQGPDIAPGHTRLYRVSHAEIHGDAPLGQSAAYNTTKARLGVEFWTPDVNEAEAYARMADSPGVEFADVPTSLAKARRAETVLSSADRAALQPSKGSVLLRPEDFASTGDLKAIPQEQYLYHLRDQIAKGGNRRARRSAAFLQERTNREAIGGVEGYVQDPRISMGVHAKGTAQEVSTVKALEDLERMSPDWTQLDTIDLKDAPMSVRAGRPVEGMPSRIVEFKEKFPQWENFYTETKLPLVHGSGREAESALVRNEVYPFFKEVKKGLESHAIRRNVEYANALWARMATGTLGFVSRNVLQGNLYMGMVLGEARNPVVWAKSLGTMKRMQRGIRQFGDPFKFVTGPERELVEGAIKDNAVEAGFLDTIQAQGDAAIEAAGGKFAKAAKGSRLSPVSTNFVGWGPVSHANQWAENWSRLSVYANKIKQGYASPEAAAVTRRVMLDYKDLAPVNETARIINPFLTWTYKSAPLIAGTLVRDPRKIKIPLALLNAINQEGRLTEQVGVTQQFQTEGGAVTLPKGLRELLPLGLGDQPQGFLPATPIHTTLETLQPLFDAIPAVRGKPGAQQKLLADVVNVIGAGGVAAGGIKAAAEGAAGTQFFTGRKFQPGQRVPTPLPLKPIFGDTMPWETWNTLNSLVPVLSRASTIAPQDDYERGKQGRSIISQFGGVTLYPQGPASVKSEVIRRNQHLAAVIKSIRDSGTKVPSRTKTKKKSGNPYG